MHAIVLCKHATWHTLFEIKSLPEGIPVKCSFCKVEKINSLEFANKLLAWRKREKMGIAYINVSRINWISCDIPLPPKHDDALRSKTLVISSTSTRAGPCCVRLLVSVSFRYSFSHKLCRKLAHGTTVLTILVNNVCRILLGTGIWPRTRRLSVQAQCAKKIINNLLTDIMYSRLPVSKKCWKKTNAICTLLDSRHNEWPHAARRLQSYVRTDNAFVGQQ